MSSVPIVIVGGGFAGFWAAAAARRVAPKAAISLLSPLDALVMRPRLYEADPHTLAAPLRPLLQPLGVDLVLASATGIDPAARLVHTDDPTSASLPYDQVVIATGSVMRRPVVPGAADAYSIDTQAEAVELDRALAGLAGRDPLTIAVVGAGFTGLELALELPARLAAHGRPSQLAPARIVLIDRAPVLGAELGEGPRPVIEDAVDRAGVERRLGVTVTALGRDVVHLDGGPPLSADAVVLCTGLAAAPFAGLPDARRDEAGRLEVDPYLRVSTQPGIFAAGDAAAADTGGGHRTLQSCQHALQTGRVAGENAARSALGLALVPYRQPNYVTCLDLGAAGAVLTRGWDREVVDAGASAKQRKRTINTSVIYPDASHGAEGLLRQSRLDPAERG